MDLTFGSGCSGIESASVAWHSLGWKTSWLAEIEKFPSKVLQHHYPDVPNLGDITKLPEMISEGRIVAPDVFIAGTPCQSFSLSGLRKGLDDERGQLTIAYVKIADAIDAVRDIPGIHVWENVVGVLSDRTNAFGNFIGGLAGTDNEVLPGNKPDDRKSSKFWKWNKEHSTHFPKWSNSGCVYGPKRTVAWRVLDAKHFGVPQQRRRVFVIASARDGFDPTEVLFERGATQENLRKVSEGRKQSARKTGDGTSAIVYGRSQQTTNHQNDVVVGDGDTWVTLQANGGNNGGGGCAILHETKGLRRIMPLEAERLQGFPDGYTDIPYGNKPCPEGPRYKALGNSKAVPVVKWIGQRIEYVLKGNR